MAKLTNNKRYRDPSTASTKKLEPRKKAKIQTEDEEPAQPQTEDVEPAKPEKKFLFPAEKMNDLRSHQKIVADGRLSDNKSAEAEDESSEPEVEKLMVNPGKEFYFLLMCLVVQAQDADFKFDWKAATRIVNRVTMTNTTTRNHQARLGRIRVQYEAVVGMFEGEDEASTEEAGGGNEKDEAEEEESARDIVLKTNKKKAPGRPRKKAPTKTTTPAKKGRTVKKAETDSD